MSRRRRYRHADQDALSLVMIILAIYSAMIAFLVWAAKSIITLINRLISASKKKKLPVVQSTDSQTETSDRLIEPTPTENKPTLTNREFPLSDSELVPAAIEIVVEAGMASTSLLQRKLKVGYATAARCIDEMERMGIVGPFEGSKPRQVLLSKERYYSMKNLGPEL